MKSFSRVLISTATTALIGLFAVANCRVRSGIRHARFIDVDDR